MAGRTPPLYTTGQWKVDAPFAVVAEGVYTCKAIRSFDEIKAGGVDPFKTYYEPLGITKADYDKDVVNQANIVTLMSDAHPLVNVPDTYILSYPDLTVVPYRHMVLSLSLGAVPDTLVLDHTLTKLEEMVSSTLGINATAQLHQVGYIDKGFSYEQHTVLEANRLSRLEETTTDYGRVQELKDKLQKANEQNAVLVQLLKDAGVLS